MFSDLQHDSMPFLLLKIFLTVLNKFFLNGGLKGMRKWKLLCFHQFRAIYFPLI